MSGTDSKLTESIYTDETKLMSRPLAQASEADI
jgi:hypothetical protein